MILVGHIPVAATVGNRTSLAEEEDRSGHNRLAAVDDMNLAVAEVVGDMNFVGAGGRPVQEYHV